MPEFKKKLIIDNNSLVDFFNYYFFDRDNGNGIYKKIKEFLYKKIESGEIIIIDKVFKEFWYTDYKKDNEEIKKRIKQRVVKTDHLIQEAEQLLDAYYIEYNARFMDKSEIEIKKDEILNGADLFLIALCKEYKNKNTDCSPIVVSEESFNQRKNNKIVEKIPIICKKEGVECIRVSHALFNIYKEELLFDLEIK